MPIIPKLIARVDLPIPRGSDVTLPFPIKVNGSLVDLTTATDIGVYVKLQDGSDDPPAPQYTLGSGVTLIDGGAGGCNVAFTAAVTDDLGWYRIQVKFPGDTVGRGYVCGAIPTYPA